VQAEVRKARTAIIDRVTAGETLGTAHRAVIIDLTVSNATAAAEMPTAFNLKSAASRATVLARPVIPLNIADLVLPVDYRNIGDRVFVQHQETFATAAGPVTMIILFIVDFLRRLLSKTLTAVDGTFDVPIQFAQLFSWHFFVGDRLFPGVFALFTSKSEECYRHFFDWIVTFATTQVPPIRIAVPVGPAGPIGGGGGVPAPGTRPKMIMDFESGLEPALRNSMLGQAPYW
jgi:hypothetical protein